MTRRQVRPNCKGDGWKINKGGRIGFGLLTLGMGWLVDVATTNHPKESMFSYRCTTCRGTGIVSLGDENG